MKRTCKRKKAFLGAIIGAVTSIAGSAISAASQRKAQEKQIKRENYINRNQSANNLSAAYSNEEYVDDFLNKTTFKYGGNKTMVELPKTKLAKKFYVNPKYSTKNTAKTPAQNLPKTRLAVKRDANVASNTTRNTTQVATKKSVQTSKANNNRNTNTNTNTISNAIKNEVKNAGRYIMAGALDMAGGLAFGPRNLARTYVKDMADIMVDGYKHFTKTSAKKPTQRSIQKNTQNTKYPNKTTITSTKSYTENKTNDVRRNTNTATKTNKMGFWKELDKKINDKIGTFEENDRKLTRKIKKIFDSNKVYTTTLHNKQNTKPSDKVIKKSASPITQTRTAVKRNANTANTTNRNTTRQATTAKPNVPAKTSTTTNRPAQRTTQRPANTSTQRPAKSTVQKTTKQPNVKTTTNKATTTKTTTQPARQNADNKLTFSRAFANARKAGKQTFNWNGKSYTTQLAGEKKNNTSEKTYNTTKLANNKLMNAKEATKPLINTIPSASSVIPKSNTLNIADNNGYYDRIKMMKCGGKRKMKCGGKCK